MTPRPRESKAARRAELLDGLWASGTPPARRGPRPSSRGGKLICPTEEAFRAVLEPLSDAWAERFPRRAWGGVWALSGFAYQFHVTVLRVIEEHLANYPGSATVTAERLSDITAAEGDGLHLIQVKRRLTRRSLHSALDEAQSILEVAAELDPAMVERLRFSVIAEEEDGDAAGVVDRWLETVADEAQRETLRAAITLETEPSPLLASLALLHNKFRAHDSIRLIERWVGQLTIDPRTAPLRIWSDLSELSQERGPRPPGVILSGDDESPAEVVIGRVLTGQQPRLHDLRAGAFAKRARCVGTLVEQIRTWAGDAEARSDDARLRVLWVTGRSGSGKSVALMQAAVAMHRAFPGPVVWLGPEHRRLPDSLRWGAEIQRTSGELVLIAVDDPYSTSDSPQIWQAATGEVLAEIEAGDIDGIPLVLACGPAEQARRLANDHLDAVAVTEVELTPATSADWIELRDFYRARTSEEPPAVASEENVLLVQAFFEWRERLTLPEFAKGFAQRVRQLSSNGAVEEYVALLLALNRLYIGLNEEIGSALLDPGSRDALSALWRDGHLTLTEEPEGGRPGTWLAHPHLSAAIYNGWFPPETSAAPAPSPPTDSSEAGADPQCRPRVLNSKWASKTGASQSRRPRPAIAGSRDRRASQ